MNDLLEERLYWDDCLEDNERSEGRLKKQLNVAGANLASHDIHLPHFDAIEESNGMRQLDFGYVRVLSVLNLPTAKNKSKVKESDSDNELWNYFAVHACDENDAQLARANLKSLPVIMLGECTAFKCATSAPFSGISWQ